MGEILHKCQFGAKLSQLIHFQVIFAFYRSSTLSTLSLPGPCSWWKVLVSALAWKGSGKNVWFLALWLSAQYPCIALWASWVVDLDKSPGGCFFNILCYVGNHHKYGKNREIEDFCPDAGPQCTDALRLSQATNVPICTLHPLPKCLFWYKSNYFLPQLDIRLMCCVTLARSNGKWGADWL